MRALLIDPENQEITEVDFDGSLHGMYAQMGCNMVEPVRLAENITLWVDEEFLFKESDFAYYIGSYPQPLQGKSLVAGTDDVGDNIDLDPDLDIELIKQQVQWLKKKE